MIDIKEPKDFLEKAEHSLKTVDHLIYITYPLIKENRLLKKIIEELYDIANNIIESILYYEFMYKRIKLYEEDKGQKTKNFEIFKTKCASNFDITVNNTHYRDGLSKHLANLCLQPLIDNFDVGRKKVVNSYW